MAPTTQSEFDLPDIRIAFVGFRHGHITSLYDLADQTVGVCIAGACEEHGPTRASLQENGVIDVSHAAAARLHAPPARWN